MKSTSAFLGAVMFLAIPFAVYGGGDIGCSSSSGGSSSGGGSGSSSGASSGASSGKSGSSSGKSGSGSGSSSSGSGSSSSSSSSGGSSSGGQTDADCQMMMGNDMNGFPLCVGCCQKIHMQGIQALVMEIQACVCGDGGACASACASEYCKNGSYTSGDACNTCISNSLSPDGGACLQQVSSACMNDANCSAYLGCANGCP